MESEIDRKFICEISIAPFDKIELILLRKVNSSFQEKNIFEKCLNSSLLKKVFLFILFQRFIDFSIMSRVRCDRKT